MISVALSRIPRYLAGENNNAEVGQVDLAAQATTDSAALLAGSDNDVRDWTSLCYTFKNTHGSNAATIQIRGANDAAFATEVVILAVTGLAAGAVATRELSRVSPLVTDVRYQLQFRYYRVMIWSASAGNAAAVQAWITAYEP